jgi:acyl carrier protein
MQEKVKAIMAQVFEVQVADIHEDLKADEVPWWDSLKHFSLITALEEEFGVQMTMDEIQAMISYKKIVETISGYLQ